LRAAFLIFFTFCLKSAEAQDSIPGRPPVVKEYNEYLRQISQNKNKRMIKLIPGIEWWHYSWNEPAEFGLLDIDFKKLMIETQTTQK
jgi:hypothetical protein